MDSIASIPSLSSSSALGGSSFMCWSAVPSFSIPYRSALINTPESAAGRSSEGISGLPKVVPALHSLQAQVKKYLDCKCTRRNSNGTLFSRYEIVI